MLFMFRVCHAFLPVLFIAALWSPAGKRASLLALLCLTFTCVLSLSHVVTLVRCGT